MNPTRAQTTKKARTTTTLPVVAWRQVIFRQAVHQFWEKS